MKSEINGDQKKFQMISNALTTKKKVINQPRSKHTHTPQTSLISITAARKLRAKSSRAKSKATITRRKHYTLSESIHHARLSTARRLCGALNRARLAPENSRGRSPGLPTNYRSPMMNARDALCTYFPRAPLRYIIPIYNTYPIQPGNSQENRGRSGGARGEKRRARPPALAAGRHLIYCFNYIGIYR